MLDIKCNIIIPVWNEKELTERCIENIQVNTATPYKIILIDNASDIETTSYLKKISEKNEGTIILIRNEINVGFPKAVNQGIAISNAPYLCVLNNDTEPYHSWLEEMIRIAESDSAIGIVNPSSNNLGQPEPLEGFSGKWIEMPSCIGFCMLIKKEVVKKIGMLDEIYSPGNFEDTDFSRRAAKAGYKCVMAKGAYVYHHQNTGFKKRKDWDERFKRNLGIFNKKWGRIERIVYIIKKADKYSLIKNSVNSFLKTGHFVQIIFKNDIPKDGMQEHLSLRVFKINSNINILWRVLMRKKRFDKIFTDSKFLVKVFHLFGHKSELINL